MSATAIVYTSTTGNTAYVADLLSKLINDSEMIDLTASQDLEQLYGYKNYIFCVSTWGNGEMQDDWELLAERFKMLSLAGCNAAILGLGDQKNYPDVFADGVRRMAELLRSLGMNLLGLTATEGYEFKHSKAIEGKHFLGCIIDEDNQHNLTEARLKVWSKALNHSFRSGKRLP